MNLQDLRDPNVKRGSIQQDEQGFYTWTMRRNGVVVTSTVPLNTWRWWDYTTLHLYWSWLSWITQILSHLGGAAAERGWKRLAHNLKRPRKYLKSRGWW